MIPSDGLYKFFKTVTYKVELIKCGITNDMLSEIDFNDITVDIIRLDGNDKLSDLKPLSDLGENLQELPFNDCSVSDVSFFANLTIGPRNSSIFVLLNSSIIVKAVSKSIVSKRDS